MGQADEAQANGFAHCAAEVKKQDPDRWLAALFAPEAARRRLFALYAFHLELAHIPDAVREPMLGEIRLQWWRETLEGIFSGTPRAQPVALALAAAHRERPITRVLLERLIDARTPDLYGTQPGDLAALETYAGETAGVLSELAAETLGADAGPSLEAARAVGTGFALVGLIRALSYHVARGRVHLPVDLMREANLATDEIGRAESEARLKPILEQMAEAAAKQFAQARALRSQVERAALPALLPASLGDLYLARLKAARFALSDPRIEAQGAARPLRLLTRAVFRRY